MLLQSSAWKKPLDALHLSLVEVAKQHLFRPLRLVPLGTFNRSP